MMSSRLDAGTHAAVAVCKRDRAQEKVNPLPEWAHSAVTRKVNAIDEGKVNGHAAFLKFASGQLLFPG
ncbi:hypothetical protein [Polaromonas sp. JS666]|uniref:hypothetical protein n=1 Tax=Polaromonas sp. (strain JS666 / ATCC BAA-500) TaxID=296591 RepID=UPI00059DFC4C|nr:hypothetical protein [Polaromonas sp. JS666]